MAESTHDREIREIRAILHDISELHQKSVIEREKRAAKWAKQQAEWAAKWAKLESERKKDDKEFQRWSQLEDYTESESKCLTDEFRDALQDAGQINGADLEFVHVHLRALRANEHIGKYDLVAINSDNAFVGDIKDNLTVQTVEKFAKNQLPHFAKHFPIITHNRQVLGMIGGKIIKKEVITAAQKLGLYVLRLNNNRKLSLTTPGRK